MRSSLKNLFGAPNWVRWSGLPMNRAWREVQSTLREKLGSQNWEIWIRPITIHSMGANTVHLQVPNRYYRDWVQANYGAMLCEEFANVLGNPVTVHFDIEQSGDQVAQAQSAQSPRNPPPQQPQHREANGHAPAMQKLEKAAVIPGLSPDKAFGNFVVGACNQFAHATALAVADSPGDPQYNPLFIYGMTGLGKTHLMAAIGNRIRKVDLDAKVLYVTAEQFTNELIDALRYRQMPSFRDKYRKHPSVLLMDDVQFLTGKDRTQEELFHTFEWLKERQRQIVFTSDVLPREIKGFEPRLRTRCESGMLADIQPPDLETMVAILQQKAADQGLEIETDLAQYISSRVNGSIREMEGVLNRLQATCRLHGTVPSLNLAKKHLTTVLTAHRRRITVDDIIQTVANFYNIKVMDMKGNRRLKQLVRPRHVAMWLVRQHTGHSFPEIGRAFGRDNATVQYACKKINKQLQRDADLQVAVDALERNLGCG